MVWFTTSNSKAAARQKLTNEIMALLDISVSPAGEAQSPQTLADNLDTLSKEALSAIAEHAQSYTYDQRAILRAFLDFLVARLAVKTSYSTRLKRKPVRQVIFYAQVVPVFEAFHSGDAAAALQAMIDFSKLSAKIFMIEELSNAQLHPHAYVIYEVIDQGRVDVLSDEHALWIEENYLRLLPILPTLFTRDTFDRGTMEMLLASNHSPVLLEGAL